MAKEVVYLGEGNTIKICYEGDEDDKRIGIIKERLQYDYVIVDFGTHERKFNVHRLIDLSIDD